MPKVELIAGHIVALFHALFLSSCLGSIATEVKHVIVLISSKIVFLQMSTYILLGIDFIINLMFTGQVSAYVDLAKCSSDKSK